MAKQEIINKYCPVIARSEATKQSQSEEIATLPTVARNDNEVMKENLAQEESLHEKKSQFFLFFLLLVILLMALTGLVFFTGKNAKQATSIQATPTPMVSVNPINAQTQLAFAPQIQLVPVGTDLNAQIYVSTGLNSLSGVQFILNFDPKIVQIMDIIPGNFFAKPTVLLKKIDNQKGKIDYALGSLTPQNGDNILATLSLKLISATTSGATKISFSQTKAADGVNNVLKSAAGLTIVVTTTK